MVVTLVAKIVRIYQETRRVLREDADALRFHTQRALAIAQSRALGGLTRVNIEEIAYTANLIGYYESRGVLYGDAYAAAIDQLRVLSRQLAQNLEELRWRIS